MDDREPDRFVWTGELRPPELATRLVDEAYARYRPDADGEVCTVYPALVRASAERFGLCVAAIGGNVHAADDADGEFTIMSVAKPFVYALVCQRVGADELRQLVGVNATPLPFNGKGGVGTFAPLLDAAGNSVKGRLAARFLSRSIGLDLCVSRAAG